ncbi:MAG: hypothetical protein ACE5DI_01510 [Candidatus Micrarchaeia archaeon]
MIKKKRVLVKIGTNLVTKGGKLNHDYIKRVAETLARVSEDHDVVLWSSGAVAAGRERLSKSNVENESIARKRMLASVGQPHLINAYEKALQKKRIELQQILITGRDLRKGTSRKILRETVDEALNGNERIIPIGNVNDPFTNEEFSHYELRALLPAIKNAWEKAKKTKRRKTKTFFKNTLKSMKVFPDNDKAITRVTKPLGIDHTIILTDVEGLMTAPPEEGGKLIENAPYSFFGVRDKTGKKIKVKLKGAKKGGLGGMYEKYLAAKRISRGTLFRGRGSGTVTIANGTNPEIIPEILSGKARGTRFNARKKRKRNI